MNITHAQFVTLPVADQDRAKTFYTDALGFDVVADRQMGPVRWLAVAPRDAQTHFVLAAAEQGFTPGSVHGTALVSADLDGDCAALRAAGAKVEGPDDQPWGRQATLEDPDGNRFMLSAEG
ncbi:VOC family protein [Streptomyces sp. NBC_01808]|uniref:VOC family protein n=1 Tax=Streptomyces sp. NBC_01808 TaxID=2975947 RepID=UPI002DDB83C5|nr:VOC family protein [Streptomyces sp. NBC_01808]WSA39828.1 VOC family protein [Streptomyces sp. NBC_01808]